MFGWTKALFAIAGLALAMPAIAQAPSPPVTAFDGNYVGRVCSQSKEHRAWQTMPPRTRAGRADDHQRRRPLLGKGQMDGNSRPRRQRHTA